MGGAAVPAAAAPPLIDPADLAALGHAIGVAVAGALPPAPGAPPGAPGPAAPAGPAGGAVRKIPTYTEAEDPAEWTVWRRRFETICEIMAWPQERRVRELSAAMGGQAARAVADIPTAGRNYDAVVADYEARFITPAASELARSEFNAARQEPGESILEWHARIRSLFLRAYPGQAADGVGAAGIPLRERFIKGLESDVIKEYVWDHRPADYAACLASAQNKMATLTMMADATGGTTKKKKDAAGSVSFISGAAKGKNAGQGGRASGASSGGAAGGLSTSCFLCQEKGHFLRDCPYLGKARASLTKKEGKKDSKGKKSKGKAKKATSSSGAAPKIGAIKEGTEEEEPSDSEEEGRAKAAEN